MRFLCVYKPAQEEGGRPNPEHVAEMGKLIDRMMKAGVLLATEGCQPSSKGARVRLAKGKVSVVDGPFTETKELIGGFAILQVSSKEEAIELTRQFLAVAGEGETEIRQLYEPSDFGPAPEEAATSAAAKG
jgi:hypothetical protein